VFVGEDSLDKQNVQTFIGHRDSGTRMTPEAWS